MGVGSDTMGKLPHPDRYGYEAISPCRTAYRATGGTTARLSLFVDALDVLVGGLRRDRRTGHDRLRRHSGDQQLENFDLTVREPVGEIS